MDTTQQITLSEAFAHCAGTSSYWIWIVITFVSVGLGTFILVRANKKTQINPWVNLLFAFVALCAITASILLRPTSVKQNTSRAAAAQGHYLGY